MTTTRTQSQTDLEIKKLVDAELAWTPSVNAANIGVAVNNGAVALSGEVDSYPEKSLAEKAALRVRGVTAIANEIEVRSAWDDPNDTDIARQAGYLLNLAVDVPESVKATVNNHVITLSGTVQWQHQRDAARRAVSYLKGVTAVVNIINLQPTVSAAHAKSAITAALVRNARVEAHNINVSTEPDGTVRLTGTVNSLNALRQAEHAAWAAPGVVAVDNQLIVLA